MAFYRGEQGTVFFDKDSNGGISEIAAVRSWSMTVEKDVLETTAQGATYKSNVGGLVSGSGTMEVMYDAPSSGDKLDLIRDVNVATDEGNASVELYLDETGAKKLRRHRDHLHRLWCYSRRAGNGDSKLHHDWRNHY
jgi:hypothetical protein